MLGRWSWWWETVVPTHDGECHWTLSTNELQYLPQTLVGRTDDASCVLTHTFILVRTKIGRALRHGTGQFSPSTGTTGIFVVTFTFPGICPWSGFFRAPAKILLDAHACSHVQIVVFGQSGQDGSIPSTAYPAKDTSKSFQREKKTKHPSFITSVTSVTSDRWWYLYRRKGLDPPLANNPKKKSNKQQSHPP